MAGSSSIAPNQEDRAVFTKLRPLCVAVMSSPSCSNLQSLRSVIEGLPSGPLPPPLVPYTLLPLRSTIKRVANSDAAVLEETLLAITSVLCRSGNLDQWEWFQDLFSFLCLLLDTKLAEEAGLAGRGSEELLLAAMKVMSSLLLSHTPSILKRVYSEPVTVGHCISVLLSHTSNPSLGHALTLAALSALSALAGLDLTPIARSVEHLQATPPGSEDFLPAVTRFAKEVEKIGSGGEEWMVSVLPSFLPGLCSSLAKLVSTDKTTTSSLVSHGLVTWAHYVGVSMGGEATPTEMGSLSSEPVAVSSYQPDTGAASSATKRRSLLVQRSGDWECATAARLHTLVQKMTVLVTADTWRTRLFLAGWAHALLIETNRVLEGCVSQWVEVLVTLAHDEFPQVSDFARLALGRFPGGDHTLSSLMGAQLHALVSSLPRLIRHHDDTRKVATLQLLAGYLQLAGGHVTLMVHSVMHLTKLVQALLEMLSLEAWPQQVLATPLPDLHPDSLSSSALCLPHAHFHSDKVAALLKEVCHLLGCRGDLPVLVDCILDQLRRSSHQQNELLLLLAYLLPGGCHDSNFHGNCRHHDDSNLTVLSLDEFYSLAEEVVGEVVSEKVWLSSESSLQKFLTVYLIHTCIHVLGAAGEPLLQVILYPLVLRLQDENRGVASAAMATLEAICHHCDYSSVADLIGRNADYLVHEISQQLRQRHQSNTRSLHHSSHAIRVLQGVVSHGNEEVCLLVKDVLDELLLSLDLQQLEAWLVWEGLEVVAQSCGRWVRQREAGETEADARKGKADHKEETGDMKGEERKDDKLGDASAAFKASGGGIRDGDKEGLDAAEAKGHREKERPEGVGLEAIGRYFMDYHKEKSRREEEEVEGGRGGEEGEEEQEPGMESYTTEPQLPCCESVAVEILHRSVHHMSHPVATVRLKVLTAVQNCLRALQSHKMSLYPEAHLVWAPLLPRLSDHAHPVAREAWQVIGCMSEVAGDFLRKRVLEKVWPLLVRSLETMATSSVKADSLYKQTAQCKLQLSLLHCVGQLSTALSLPSLSFEEGAVGVSLYLHDDQSQVLQEAARDVMEQLVKVDADMVWLILAQLSPSSVVQATISPLLTPYKFPSHENDRKYSKNVQKLLPLTQLP